MTEARVWAVVLMYGKEEVTANCIASLLAQDHPAVSVLLVDNNAADGAGSRLRARFPSIRYLATGANLGYAGGMNRGIAHALAQGCDDILLLNNDTTLATDCVSTLVRARHTLPDVGALAPRILCAGGPGARVWYAGGHLSRTRAVGVHHRFGEPDHTLASAPVQPVTFISGCAMLLPADVARSVGGFDEDFFMYCEDVELCLRLTRARRSLYYVPGAVVYHHDEPAEEPAPFEIRHRDRNRRRIARRLLTLPERAAFVAWFYPTRLIHLARYLARGDRARAAAVVSGVFES